MQSTYRAIILSFFISASAFSFERVDEKYSVCENEKFLEIIKIHIGTNANNLELGMGTSVFNAQFEQQIFTYENYGNKYIGTVELSHQTCKFLTIGSTIGIKH
jgi:hypothetical protein